MNPSRLRERCKRFTARIAGSPGVSVDSFACTMIVVRASQVIRIRSLLFLVLSQCSSMYILFRIRRIVMAHRCFEQKAVTCWSNFRDQFSKSRQVRPYISQGMEDIYYSIHRSGFSHEVLIIYTDVKRSNLAASSMHDNSECFRWYNCCYEPNDASD